MVIRFLGSCPANGVRFKGYAVWYGISFSRYSTVQYLVFERKSEGLGEDHYFKGIVFPLVSGVIVTSLVSRLLIR